MIQNEKFHKTWELWLQAVLPRLRTEAFEYYTGIKPPLVVDQLSEQIIKPNDNYFGIFQHMQPHMGWMPEFKNIANIITRTPELESIFYHDLEGQPIEATEIQLLWLDAYCEKFMLTYLNAVKDLVFVSTEFERVYGALEKFIYNAEPFEDLWL